jgi:hypothetical protein
MMEGGMNIALQMKEIQEEIMLQGMTNKVDQQIDNRRKLSLKISNKMAPRSRELDFLRWYYKPMDLKMDA